MTSPAMPATMECSNTSLDEDQTSLKKALSSFAERTNNPGTLGIPTTSQRRKRKATVQHTEQLAPIQRANECATDEPRGNVCYDMTAHTMTIDQPVVV